MSSLAPKTEGHYPNYRLPPPPDFTLEEGNQEIRNRQLEMIDLYNVLHHDLNTCVTVNGGGQFTNRSDNQRELQARAASDLRVARSAVVRALTRIILLGGTPPPPRRDVDDEVHQLLGYPRLIPAAYTAAGVPAPAPAPAPPPAPRPNPPAARPSNWTIPNRSLVPQPSLPLYPAPHHWYPPHHPQPIPPAPQSNPPAARPREWTVLYPPAPRREAPRLSWEQQQANLRREGKTVLAQARARWHQAGLQYLIAEEGPSADLMLAQMQARQAELDALVAEEGPPADPTQTQTQLQPAHPMQAAVRTVGTSSGSRVSTQAQMRREQQQAQSQDHQAQDHQPQQPAPTQAPPQPARTTQEAPARSAGKKNVQDPSSSVSRGRGR